MEENKSNINDLAEHVKEYVEARIDLMKIDAADRLSSAASSIASMLILMIMGIFFLLFASAAVAHKIGESLGSFVGYSIVAGFYLTLLILIVLLREPLGNRVEKKIKDIIIKK